MFVELASAVEELEIPLHGAGLAEVIGLRDRLDARIAVAVGLFDRAGLWEVEGATSMIAWLRDRGGVAKSQAGRLRLTGKRLVELPTVAAAARDGVLSGGQVQAIVSTVTDATVAQFAEQETDLVAVLAGLDLADTIVVLNQCQDRAEALLDLPEPMEPARSLHHSHTFGGRWEGTWSLDPEGGAVVDAALRVASTNDADGDEPRTAAQRRADAFVDVCRYFLDHQHGNVGGRHRPHVNVIVNTDLDGHPTSARIVDGPELDEWSWRRLLCDCTFHRIVMAGKSTILDFGRSTRTVTASLWNGLVARDHHCRFPGCDRPVHWCEAHHVQPWEHDGETNPDNLVLLCSRHHHQLHKPGWHAKLLPDATLKITSADGTVRTSHPAGALKLGAAVEPRGPT
jgi:hypothetical protein